MVIARDGWNPISTSSTRIRLRTSRPAPTTRTQAKATSATTSALRTHARCRPSVEPRAASLSALVSAVPRSWSAGASPNTIPVAIAIARVKVNAVRSVCTSCSSGMLTASSRASARVPATANTSPRSAPLHDSTMPSVSSCASRRRRPAPRAVRIATSFCRVAVRARSRLERLAQTISITIPTAPASTQTASRTRPLTCSASGLTLPWKPLRSGCSATIWPAIVLISARACSTVTPGLSRPIMAIVLPQRFVSWLSGKGK